MLCFLLQVEASSVYAASKEGGHRRGALSQAARVGGPWEAAHPFLPGPRCLVCEHRESRPDRGTCPFALHWPGVARESRPEGGAPGCCSRSGQKVGTVVCLLLSARAKGVQLAVGLVLAGNLCVGSRHRQVTGPSPSGLRGLLSGLSFVGGWSGPGNQGAAGRVPVQLKVLAGCGPSSLCLCSGGQARQSQAPRGQRPQCPRPRPTVWKGVLRAPRALGWGPVGYRSRGWQRPEGGILMLTQLTVQPPGGQKEPVGLGALANPGTRWRGRSD